MNVGWNSGSEIPCHSYLLVAVPNPVINREAHQWLFPRVQTARREKIAVKLHPVPPLEYVRFNLHRPFNFSFEDFSLTWSDFMGILFSAYIIEISGQVIFVPVLDSAHHHEEVWEAEVASRIPNLDTRWCWLVSFKAPALYPRRGGGGITHCTQWTGNSVGRTAFPNNAGKRKSLCVYRDYNRDIRGNLSAALIIIVSA